MKTEVDILRTALLQWKCGACGGSGKYHHNRSVSERKREQGQTLDAHFNPEPVICKVCGGDGLNPVASAALKAAGK